MIISSKVYIASIITIGLLSYVINAMYSGSSQYKEQPYYSGTAFNVFMPLSVIYTCFAQLWVYGTGRQQNIVRKLPLSLQSTSSSNSRSVNNKNKKIAIITGANTGIGYESARTLVVEYGWDVILACRSKDKAIQAMNTINQEVASANSMITNNNNNNGGKAIVLDQPLDLSDFRSIKQFVNAIQTKYTNNNRYIDVLVNNAGRNTSGKSGKFDLMFQSNFLGHFLLTNLLLDKLNTQNKQKQQALDQLKTNDIGQPQPQEQEHEQQDLDYNDYTIPRIINLSSVTHHFVGPNKPIDDIEYWKSLALYNNSDQYPERYSASKLAAILFTNELNRRFSYNISPSGASSNNNSNKNDTQQQGQRRIQSIAVNPGSCSSDIWRYYPNWLKKAFSLVYLTPKQGSVPVVAAALLSDDDLTLNSNNDNQRITYLQPYWLPSSSSSNNDVDIINTKSLTTISNTPIPFMEMLGPYVGYNPTQPRLPSHDNGEKAAIALWTLCETLVESSFPSSLQ